MKSIKEILKFLGAKAEKILWVLGFRAFLFILIFILIDFILGGLIFYKYVYVAENKIPRVTENIVKFDDRTYQSILIELQSKEQN